MEVGDIIDILLQITSTALRGAHYVVDVAFMQLGDKASVARTYLFFNITNKQTRIIWAHLSPHGHTSNLAIVLSIKRKGVEDEYKFASRVRVWVGGSLTVRWSR